MASTKTNSGSITAHPAFPLVVALWFAALLGLGSLILPAALIERLAVSTGIANLIPAAAPPLGFTARIAIAVAAAVLGALLGLLTARKTARPAPETARRRSIKSDENPRRQPVKAHEELGSPSFDSVAGFATARRKTLAGEEESGPSDFLQLAPLPEASEAHGFAYGTSAEQPRAADSLDLDDCAEFTEDSSQPLPTASQEEAIGTSQTRVTSPSRAELASREPLTFSPPSMARQPAPASPPDEIEFATFEDDHDSAPSEPELEPEPEPEAAPEPESEPHEYFSPPEADEPVSAEPEAAPQPAAEPGLVQLVEKLGATLQRRREWSAKQIAQQAEAQRFPRAVVQGDGPAEPASNFEAAAPAEAAQAMAAFFAQPAAEQDEPAAAAGSEPTQMRPFAGLNRIEDMDGDDDLDELAASFSLPLASVAAAPAAAPVEEVAAPDAELAPDSEAASSPLAAKNPFRDNRPEFVRIEEPEPAADTAPPAVVFPHEMPAARMFDRPGAPSPARVVGIPGSSLAPRPAASNADNDRVLREALMNLQRIGKN